MKIAVIGIGNVGSVLGRRWSEAGHEVVFGVRDLAKPEVVATAKAFNAHLATVAEAAAGADVVVLAVPWKAVPDAIASAGDLAGKVLLDCTNPLTPDLSGLVVEGTSSGGEQVAQLAPAARVVKIFNTTGAANMANPRYGETGISMLYAGDDAQAKQAAARLAADLGFEPIDAGPLSAAGMLERFALLWITLAIRQQMGPDFALTLLRRPAG